MADLTSKAMLVRLNVSIWPAKKFDKKVSDKVAADHNASPDAGRYNKQLIAAEAQKAMERVRSDARNFHYEQTLPWTDDDYRILPALNHGYYTQKMREFEMLFENAAREFFGVYASCVNNARMTLGSMFDPRDYPSQYEIEQKYKFRVHIKPLPLEKDFRVDLGDLELQALKDDLAREHKESEQRLHRDLWDRLYKAVAHVAERLDGKEEKKKEVDGKVTVELKDKTFKDTLVGNLVELCQLLPLLNVLDDPNLESLRQEIETKLTIYTPEILRENMGERRAAAKDAKDIAQRAATYMDALNTAPDAMMDMMAGYMGVNPEGN